MSTKNYRNKYLMIGVLLLVTLAGMITWQVGIVYECEPLPIDLAIQNLALSLRSEALNLVMTTITHTADTKTIVAFCAILVVLPTRKKYGIPVTLAALGGLSIYKPMKHLFLRQRPDVALHLVEQGGYSFPSGHSVTSVVVYGLLLYLIQKHCKNPVAKSILSVICLVLALTVGPSRVYVGVHWPTDVMAGWVIGLAVVLLSIFVLEWLEKRKER